MDVRPAVTNKIKEKVNYVWKLSSTNNNGETVLKNHQNLNDLPDSSVETVKIGGIKEPIFVPGKTTLTVSGIT